MPSCDGSNCGACACGCSSVDESTEITHLRNENDRLKDELRKLKEHLTFLAASLEDDLTK